MTGWPDARLIDRLKIEHPILCAPMAGAMSTPVAAATGMAIGRMIANVLQLLPVANAIPQAARKTRT